jgi:hypothetical protein
VAKRYQEVQIGMYLGRQVAIVIGADTVGSERCWSVTGRYQKALNGTGRNRKFRKAQNVTNGVHRCSMVSKDAQRFPELFKGTHKGQNVYRGV